MQDGKSFAKRVKTVEIDHTLCARRTRWVTIAIVKHQREEIYTVYMATIWLNYLSTATIVNNFTVVTRKTPILKSHKTYVRL